MQKLALGIINSDTMSVDYRGLWHGKLSLETKVITASILKLTSNLKGLPFELSYQERGGVEGCNRDGIKNLRLLQSIEFLFSVAQNLLQEGLLPGIKLQDLNSI